MSFTSKYGIWSLLVFMAEMSYRLPLDGVVGVRKQTVLFLTKGTINKNVANKILVFIICFKYFSLYFLKDG